MIVAVASRKPAITTTSLPFTRTAHTCQVSRNRLHHHLPVPADRRTRRSPLPARPSPRRRRRRRADRSGSAPWRSTRTTDPITHRRVSSLPAFRCIGWLEREGIYTETRKILSVTDCMLYVVHLSQSVECQKNAPHIAQRHAIECVSRVIAMRLSMLSFGVAWQQIPKTPHDFC